MNLQTAVRPAVPMMDEAPNQLRLAATKETRFPVCVVDSQIVLTTQPMQSWASSSILLASPSITTTTTTTLPGTPQPKRTEKSGLTATTAAAAAASFPPSHLRVGDRGGPLKQGGSQEEVPLRSVYSPPPTPPSPTPPQLERVNSAVPILAASSLPQSILTHPVYKTLSQQPLYYQTTAVFRLIQEWKSRLFWVWRKCG